MHKKLTFVITLAFAALLMVTSCNDEGKYEIKNGTVVYTYWTFSFGTIEHELKDADATTFQSIERWLGRDATHVWFKDRLMEGADPGSLKADDYPLCHDKRDYYYQGAPLHVADMNSFDIKKLDDSELWATDSQYIYFDSIRIEGGDPATFEYIEHLEAKDHLNVYYYGRVLPDADPATYKSMSIYSKDKSHVWYCGEIVEGADPETFEVESTLEFEKPDAHDKFRSYRRGEPFESNNN